MSSIYVISSSDAYKVGLAKDPHKRLQLLQTGNSTKLAVCFSYSVSSHLAFDIERRSHWLLREFKQHGEWFSAPLHVIKVAVEQAIAEDGVGEKLKLKLNITRPGNVGRKKLWTERLTLPLTTETVERMDAALADKEARLDLIRAGIERELKRREKPRAGKKPRPQG